jgi:hypothetical protein
MAAAAMDVDAMVVDVSGSLRVFVEGPQKRAPLISTEPGRLK